MTRIFRSIAPALTLALAPATHALDLVPRASTWDFMHPTDNTDPALADTDFDTTWMLDATAFAANYNGPAFGTDPAVFGVPFDSGTGVAPIGYGAVAGIDPLGTTLTTPASGSRATAYFRHTFTVLDPVDNLALEILADDAAVVYIDGVEIARLNFPAAFGDRFPVNSLAVGNEASASLLEGGLGGLAAGEHTIAVSIHQASNTSSDLGFDLRLSDEGLSGPPIGEILLGAAPAAPLIVTGDLMGWSARDTNEVAVTGGGTTTLRSETIDISGAADTQFSVLLGAEEVSGGSNFEIGDTLSAYLEVREDDAISIIPLHPYGLDLDGDGTINGDEFAPGVATNFATLFSRLVGARIPAAATEVTFVVESTCDSSTETFIIGGALLEEVGPAPAALGTADLGAPVDIGVRFGVAPWTETASKEFTLNGSVITGTIISEDIDLTGSPAATASLVLTASETSTGSNFEDTDAVLAFVEVTDFEGRGSTIQLINGGPDTDGNNVLSGEEIAPGVDVGEEVSETYILSQALPAGSVKARFFIRAVNNSSSETFVLSEIKIETTPPTFAIIDLVESAGEVDLTFESEAGVTYDLQFSPNLTNGTWTTVDTVVATGPVTAVNHGADAAQGFYRVARQP